MDSESRTDAADQGCRRADVPRVCYGGIADLGSDSATSYSNNMIDANAVYFVLALIVIYAAAFFLSPNRVAEFWERDDLPVHEIMKHFRYRERRRVWISGVGFGTCVILASLFAASIIAPVAMFFGVMSLAGADAFQIRRLSRDLPSWSPSNGTDPNARMNRRPFLDLLFGEKPTGDRRGK